MTIVGLVGLGLVYGTFDAIKDRTAHYDNVKDIVPSFMKNWCSYAKYIEKKSKFEDIFPYFHDAWHFSKFIQYLDIAVIVWYCTNDITLSVATLMATILSFNLFYAKSNKNS